jgi:hypothetical protein
MESCCDESIMTTSESGKGGGEDKPQAKGPWISRFAIKLLTIALGVLIYWLLGFIVNDIGSVRGPDYDAIEKSHLDAGLVERQGVLDEEIATTQRLIDRQKNKQQLLSQSSQGLQKTMGQLLELQKMSLEKNLSLSAEQNASFKSSLDVFLSNQKSFQSINEEVASQVEKKEGLEEELRVIRKKLDEQREPAREEYRRLLEKHGNRLAMLKLLVLVTLLVAGVWFLLNKRGNPYYPLFLAFGGATSVKMLMVMHEHFPQRYFKYVLILIALLGAARLLIYFIRSITAPRKEKVVQQYREAYEKFLCPICEYPIRRGPMKYLYWNRRTLKKLKLPEGGFDKEDEGPYTCPSCSSALYTECSSCHSIRPALLPFCDHCGSEAG